MNASETIATTFNDFRVRDDSLAELVMKAEFLVKVASAFALSGLAGTAADQLRAAREVSLGSALPLLEKACGVDGVDSEVIRELSRTAVGLLTTTFNTRVPRLSRLKDMRTSLFHGAGVPPEVEYDELTRQLASAIRRAESAVIQAVSRSTLELIAPRAEGVVELLLRTGQESLPLFPFIAWHEQRHSILFMSRVNNRGLSLTGAVAAQATLVPLAEIRALCQRLFGGPGDQDSRLADFIESILEDVGCFSEREAAPDFLVDSGTVFVNWTFIDGSATRPRRDRFRVGPNNLWQWQSAENVWTGYTAFLRDVANWSTLAKRVHSITRRRQDTEGVRIRQAGAVEQQDDRLLPIRVLMHGEETTFTRFVEKVVDDVEVARGDTALYFLHGEAGAGKTTGLLAAVAAQAEKVSEATSSDSPLLLFVSAGGFVLENLEQAINSIVAETRMLTANGVRALCRNGLMIPVIDGFDELVGTPSYGDALGALRPWLESLGERGVMLVSARSSYFVGEFADSQARESNGDLHLVCRSAHLRPCAWADVRQFLIAAGVSDSTLSGLSKEERSLLGLPYFAQQSIAFLCGPSAGGDLVSYVVGQYVRRERAKLMLPNEVELIDSAQIFEIMEELARWMLDEGVREVALESMSLIASTVLGDGMTTAIRNRLGNLCGVDAGAGGARRFRFKHELMFDLFLGLSLLRSLESHAFESVRKLVASRVLTAGVVRSLNHAKPEALLTLINLTKREVSGEATITLRVNRGELWTAYLDFTRGTPCEVVDADFQTLDLGARASGEVHFRGCSFESVVAPAAISAPVVFQDCSISEFRGSGRLSHVDFRQTLPRSALLATQFAIDEEEVLAALERAGAAGLPSLASPEPGQIGTTAEFSEFFLRRLCGSATRTIVVGDDLQPEDDPRLGWIHRHPEQWVNFVGHLKAVNLARLDPLVSSGRSKSRFVLELTAETILGRSATERRVREFWQSFSLQT